MVSLFLADAALKKVSNSTSTLLVLLSALVVAVSSLVSRLFSNLSSHTHLLLGALLTVKVRALIMNNTTYQCGGVTPSQLELFKVISFWIGGIVQLVLSIIGIIFNCIAIPVLRSKVLYKSTFNRLLIILSFFDNGYLVLAIGECFRRELGLATWPHNVVFVNVLYPLHNIVLCLSIFMTVALAKERYKAISNPIDYHAIIVSGRQWQRAFKYVLPAFFASVIFNLPKFLELQTKYIKSHDNSTIERVSFLLLFCVA